MNKNDKKQCDHVWQEMPDGSLRCFECDAFSDNQFMKIKVAFTIRLSDHEATEMLREANARGYSGTDRRKLIRLLIRDGTSAVDSTPPDKPRSIH